MTSLNIAEQAIDSLTNRFCYWQGASGKRYLFSEIAQLDIPSFSDCILLVAIGTQDNQQLFCWAGDCSDFSLDRLKRIAQNAGHNVRYYVHMLADNLLERRVVTSDLRRAAKCSACELCA